MQDCYGLTSDLSICTGTCSILKDLDRDEGHKTLDLLSSICKIAHFKTQSVHADILQEIAQFTKKRCRFVFAVCFDSGKCSAETSQQ